MNNWFLAAAVASAAMSFTWPAIYAGAWELAIMATLLSCLFTIWSVGIVFINRGEWLQFPQWLFFAPVTFLGAIGLFGV